MEFILDSQHFKGLGPVIEDGSWKTGGKLPRICEMNES